MRCWRLTASRTWLYRRIPTSIILLSARRPPMPFTTFSRSTAIATAPAASPSWFGSAATTAGLIHSKSRISMLRRRLPNSIHLSHRQLAKSGGEYVLPANQYDPADAATPQGDTAQEQIHTVTTVTSDRTIDVSAPAQTVPIEDQSRSRRFDNGFAIW